MIYTIGLAIICFSVWRFMQVREEVRTMRTGRLINGLTFRGDDFSLCEGYDGGLSCITDNTTGAIYCHDYDAGWSMQHPEVYKFGDMDSIRIDDVFREWERD